MVAPSSRPTPRNSLDWIRLKFLGYDSELRDLRARIIAPKPTSFSGHAPARTVPEGGQPGQLLSIDEDGALIWVDR